MRKVEKETSVVKLPELAGVIVNFVRAYYRKEVKRNDVASTSFRIVTIRFTCFCGIYLWPCVHGAQRQVLLSVLQTRLLELGEI